MESNTKKIHTQAAGPRSLISAFISDFIDLEKGFPGTFTTLMKEPASVIMSDLKGSASPYVSAFRYLAFSLVLFLSLFSFFYEPDKIGGVFYQAWLTQTLALGEMLEVSTGDEMILNQKNFDQFFVIMTSYFNWSFKLGALAYIGFGALVSRQLLKAKDWSGSQHILLNTRIYTQVLIYCTIASLPFVLFGVGFWNMQTITGLFQLGFTCWVFRQFLKQQFEHPGKMAWKLTLYGSTLAFLFLFLSGALIGFLSELNFPIWY
jgi:hypothetical protein